MTGDQGQHIPCRGDEVEAWLMRRLNLIADAAPGERVTLMIVLQDYRACADAGIPLSTSFVDDGD